MIRDDQSQLDEEEDYKGGY